MPGIVELVSLISDDVVAGLAAAGYPELTDEAILLGRQHDYEASAPPRIIFTPTGSSFGMKDVYNATETSLQRAQRAIMNDQITFEVRCWGQAVPADPDNDFDVTQALYQQVLISVFNLTQGSFVVGNGTWTDSKTSAGQLIRAGREFVFSVTFGTPVLGTLLEYAPDDVAPAVTDTMILPTGEDEVGCEEGGGF